MKKKRKRTQRRHVGWLKKDGARITENVLDVPVYALMECRAIAQRVRAAHLHCIQATPTPARTVTRVAECTKLLSSRLSECRQMSGRLSLRCVIN